jgi:hypothetical protein
MTDDRDPKLELLFQEAEANFADDSFTEAVNAGLLRRRRRILFGRLAVLAALAVLEVVLESPLRRYLGVVAEVLGTPLLAVHDDWLTFVFAPINSVAGLIGLLLLGLNTLYRKILY